jgi:beta-lactamase class C
MRGAISLAAAAMVVVGLAVRADAQPARNPGPCAEITAACQSAGFVAGGIGTGNGLLADCVAPIMQGTAQPAQARRPLPQVDPQLVAQCKAINPRFGQASAQPASAGTAGAGAGACAADFQTHAQAAVEDYLVKSRAPGVAVAFFDNGNSCLLVRGSKGGRGAGPVTAQTIFAMGSVQKVFNSVLLASEIVQGQVSIEDPASKYLVAANGGRIKPGSAFARITLRNLATHTAALPDAEPNARERDGWSLYRDRPMPVSTMAYLNSWKPPYPPGTRYSYSNLGFVLLGYAATALANKPYTAALAEAVTGPIGMTRTARPICDAPNPLCASAYDAMGQPAKGTPVGLWTTAEDMLLFIEANLGFLQLPDLQARAIAMTHEELFRENNNHAGGMAWEIWHGGDALLLSKNGIESGFTTWLAIQPNRGRGVAVLSNGAGKPPPATLGEALLALAAGH